MTSSNIKHTRTHTITLRNTKSDPISFITSNVGELKVVFLFHYIVSSVFLLLIIFWYEMKIVNEFICIYSDAFDSFRLFLYGSTVASVSSEEGKQVPVKEHFTQNPTELLYTSGVKLRKMQCFIHHFNSPGNRKKALKMSLKQ